jgi:hypothetical protein
MSLMWMPAQTTQPPFRTARRPAGTVGGEDDHRVELGGRPFDRVACPNRSEGASELLRLDVGGPRARVDVTALCHRDLADDVRRGTEAVEANGTRITCQTERPVPDESRAQQGRGLRVRVALGDRKAEALVGDCQLGEAAVDVIPREASVVAQVLTSGNAVPADPARRAEPRHADPCSESKPSAAADHLPDDLVSEDERQLRVLELAVEDVEVGTTGAARAHSKENLPGSGLRVRDVSEHERRAWGLEDHGSHDTAFIPGGASQSAPCGQVRRRKR